MAAPNNTMLIKTVATILTTDTAGNVIEAIPVRVADGMDTDWSGHPVDVPNALEDPTGVRVRVVLTDTALDASGKRIDVLPVTLLP